MLERNNGLTIRGESVQPLDDNTLLAQQAVIISGCQTTVCLWHARPTDPDLLVQLRSVQTPANEDAWTIARSANNQNDVSQIDLQLARHLRPQLVSKAASSHGKGLVTTREDSLPGLLATHRNRSHVRSDEVRVLGPFCSPPNQLYKDNYSKLRFDVLKKCTDRPWCLGVEDRVFSCIFAAVEAGRRATQYAKDTYSGEAQVTGHFVSSAGGNPRMAWTTGV